MASRRRKMNRADRAKQFMPFDALKGFREALLEKERAIVPRKVLPEEHTEELNRKFSRIQKKDIITVEYFHEGAYLQITGMVSQIDETSRMIKIVNTKISFEDIADLPS